jgi:hypothetical protein
MKVSYEGEDRRVYRPKRICILVKIRRLFETYEDLKELKIIQASSLSSETSIKQKKISLET